jgi:uncharacterized protein (UPF0332 family)
VKETDDLLRKANRFLRTAELALDDGDYDSCVSRCYYAMFFMAEAILFSKGMRASSHKGVIKLFGEHFVKTGIVEAEFGKMLKRAYDSRQKGDYAIGFAVSEKEARESLERAKSFVSKVMSYIKKEE